MRSHKAIHSRILVSLALTLFCAAALMAQDSVTGNSAAPSFSHSIKARLEKIRADVRQPAAAPAAAASSTAGVDRQDHDRRDGERRDPRFPDLQMQPASLPTARIPGSPTAAERYVFGRMDLATGNNPNAVATGAFQTGGPQSMAVANYYSSTVSIFLGNPDGTMQPRVDYATGVES